MASLDHIKPGDVLYDSHRERAGNTTMTRMGTWRVHVLAVNPSATESGAVQIGTAQFVLRPRSALVSWNSNTPTVYPERQIKRLRRTPVKTKERSW